MPASQVLSGVGDPNGVVAGNPGDVYQEQTGQFWLNAAAPSTWIKLGGGSAAPYWSVFPATVPTIHTIYARQSGDDTTGDGTLANPYRTFQRSIRDVPPLIPPGEQFDVDVTDLGLEMFPPGYQVPQIQASSLMYTWFENPVGPFAWTAPLNIRATPQPVASIPLGDTLLPAGSYTVVTDPDTFLGTITLTGPARASWDSDALKGKMLIPVGGQIDIPAYVTCVIHRSTTSEISVTNLASYINGDLQIVEPSATFQGSELNPGQPFTGQTFWQGGSFQAIGVNAIAFQGIRFVNNDPNTWAAALTLAGNDLPIVELCDIDGGLCLIRNQLDVAIYKSVIRSASKTFVGESAVIITEGALFLDVSDWYVVTGSATIATSVFDNCAPFGTSPNFTANGGLSNISTEIYASLFKNAPGPQGAVWARAIGIWSFEDSKIENTVAGDGILVEGPAAIVMLKHVNGSGNAGVGVRVNDGGSVRVFDDGTAITGTGGDMKVGTLAPRAWLDFRTIAPIKNEYDLSTPFVAASTGVLQPPGDELTGAGTGGRSNSRLFQRP